METTRGWCSVKSTWPTLTATVRMNSSAGIRPTSCDALERIAQLGDPDARAWRGRGDTDLLPPQQGITVMGTPLGDPAYIRAHLETKAAEQRLQSAWMILLQWPSMREHTTTTFGAVCAVSAMSTRTRERTSEAVPICHWFWWCWSQDCVQDQ